MQEFKVMCIDKGKHNPYYQGTSHGVVEGEIYTVINCVSGYSSFAKCNINAYELAEINDAYFDSRQFIPLSEIDETEFVRESIKQPA